MTARGPHRALLRATLGLICALGSLAGAAVVGGGFDGQVAEVESATESFYQALNAADAVAADRFLLPGGDSFPRSGRELEPEADTAEQSLRNLEDLFRAGLRFHVRIRDLRVRCYGGAAVATFYTEGSTTPAGGRPASMGVFRASYVWVKVPSGWKIAHFHLSPLVPR